MSRSILIEAIREILEDATLQELDLIYRLIKNMVSK